jgi:hypothetical protein
MMVTLVRQEILRGKHIREGGVSPRDWLHFISSLLCHDIGYVRGVCSGHGNGRYVCNEQGDLTSLDRKCLCGNGLEEHSSCSSTPWP